MSINVEDFKIYRADISMIKQFVELEGICFTGDLISESEYKKLFQRKNVRIYGLWYMDKLISSAIVIFKMHSKRCRIYSLCVHPDFSNMGIGKAVLNAVEQQAAQIGYINMYLELRVDNQAAYHCYSTSGYFSMQHLKEYYEDKTDGVRMMKILTEKSIFTLSKFQQTLRGYVNG